jgi:hypothetical protein
VYEILSLCCVLLMTIALGACGSSDGGGRSDGRTSTVGQRVAVAGPTIDSASPTYAVGADVTINFSGLPGNMNDYIAIAPQGAALGSYVTYRYTGGDVSGSYNMGAVAAGTYVARAFQDNSQTLLAESAAFTIGSPPPPPPPPGNPAINSSALNYALGADVSVTFSGLPGNQYDYIAIAPQGAAAGSYVTYRYTAGDVSGTYNMGPVAAGTYVARAFENNSQTLLAESPAFTVGTPPPPPGNPTIATSSLTYAVGASVSVTYGGLPGNAGDYITIAPQGSPLSEKVLYQYTGGAAAGTIDFGAVANGTYVARAFENNTLTLLAESPAFTVGPVVPTVAAGQASYGSGEDVVIVYDKLPGNQYDYIAIAPQGAPNSNYVAYRYTAGSMNGSFNFGPIADGTYVARAFLDNSSTLLAESAPFTVGPVAPPPGVPTLSSQSASYAAGAPLMLDFSGLPANQGVFIAIAPQGSPDSAFVAYQYTAGATSGSFNMGAVSDGTYVARAFQDSTATKLVESASFTVGVAAPPPGVPALSSQSASYAAGAPVTLDFTGLPANQGVFLVIAADGSPNSDFVAYQYTSGASAGSFNMGAVAPGTYVARAFQDSSANLIIQSTTFTINP